MGRGLSLGVEESQSVSPHQNMRILRGVVKYAMIIPATMAMPPISPLAMPMFAFSMSPEIVAEYAMPLMTTLPRKAKLMQSKTTCHSAEHKRRIKRTIGKTTMNSAIIVAMRSRVPPMFSGSKAVCSVEDIDSVKSENENGKNEEKLGMFSMMFLSPG